MQPNNGQNQNQDSSQQQNQTTQTQDTRSADDKLLDDIFGADSSTQNNTQQTQTNSNQTQQPNTQQNNQQQNNQTQNQNNNSQQNGDKGNQQQQQVLNNPEYDKQFQNHSTQLDNVSKMLREQQLNTIFNSQNGKFYKPYEDRLKRAAMDPKNLGLSMDQVIATTLSPNEIMKIGAKIFQNAESTARQNSTGGDNGAGDTTQAKEISKINFKDTAEMPSDKFKEMLALAKQGHYIKK